MSSKNKLNNKSIRRSQRAAGCESSYTPVSAIAQKTSARLLSNPKQKMTGNTRRRLKKSRGFNVQPTFQSIRTAHIVPEVKVALKLEALPMVKLIRRLKQAARRASTCKHILLDLAHDSKFTQGLVAEQIHQLSLCRQISAEISVRNHNTQH